MSKYGTLYSNLRVYWSRDFPAYNPNEQYSEKSQESKDIDKDIEKEGGIRDREKFERELALIMKNDFSFMGYEQNEEKQDCTLTEDNLIGS